jgi:hypothetical protein
MFKKILKYTLYTFVGLFFLVFLFINTENYSPYISELLVALLIIGPPILAEMEAFDKSQLVNYETAKYYVYEKDYKLKWDGGIKRDLERDIEPVKEEYHYLLDNESILIIDRDKHYKDIKRNKNMVYGFILLVIVIGVINFIIGIS